MNGPAKVGDLDLAVKAKEEVLRLDVTMDDLTGVAVHQSIG